MRAMVGISCCVKAFGIFGTPNHAASDSYVRVSLGPVGAVPVLLPAAGEALVPDILPRLDGLLLTGSRSNVHPDFYDGPAHAEGTPEDVQRDSTTLPLIRAAVAEGLPVLAICRGFQELNVALGGSLDQRIQDLPGRIDHSTPSDQKLPGVRTGKAHAVRIAPDGQLARLWAAAGLRVAPEAVPVNSLHNQGICRLAPRLVAEAWAPDGTVEAVRLAEAPGFCCGVQWHPEYDWEQDARSRAIFEAFGTAVAAWAAGRRPEQAARRAAA
ncbi:gamma-glutamyl-gamma-aminobutyrate hydrolase family protein [Falsiroseomonas selenitidurans]|uniref:Gamma-glutamyl-gamma-aminobutyrate hydrolase family protein n=1 Tax=Falsiroseomonas selenitidurans TaxID=2716335 RepID=A0ABX1DZY9_9PROT|nr:gamma-glutamyl-gamma-aminobutyrate hydrolase family protein [Falsiroseomonas selenitidurans]NKC30469.1 gamma-glutamyl-gamma-aminobutyrate hydrolase family protein [Falsiroseomonas selenitidurans]